MRRYTERMSFAVPADEKARMKAKAASLGISLSEYVRHVIDLIIAEENLKVRR
jgi:predicted DNA-binding protein